MNDILLSDIYDKMKKLLIFMLIATALSGATASAQTEVPDSIAQKVNMTDSLGNSGAASPAGALGGELLTDSASLQNYSPIPPLPSPYLGSIPGTLQAYRLSVPTDGRIFLWKNGGIFGSVSNASLPGLMGIEQGALNFVQQLGRLTISAHADAVKYGYYGRLQTSLGYGGSLSYQFSDRLSMTLFGSYYTPINRLAMTPAMHGYTSITSFGGYFDYGISEHWGVKVGAQAYRSAMNNRIEAQPIVIPYYRFSNGLEIGADVGGMLYNVIRSKHERRNSNPTIGLPKFGPPPVPPHR